MKIKREFMTQQAWLEMSSSRHNRILSEDLEEGLVDFQALKDFRTILNKVAKKVVHLLEIFLRSLRNFLEASLKAKKVKPLKKEKI